MPEANLDAKTVTQFTSRFTGELPINKVDFKMKGGLAEQNRQEQNDNRLRNMQRHWLNVNLTPLSRPIFN